MDVDLVVLSRSRYVVEIERKEEMHVCAEEQDGYGGPDNDDASTRTQLFALERNPDRYQTLRRQQDQRPRRHLPPEADLSIFDHPRSGVVIFWQRWSARMHVCIFVFHRPIITFEIPNIESSFVGRPMQVGLSNHARREANCRSCLTGVGVLMQVFCRIPYYVPPNLDNFDILSNLSKLPRSDRFG